MDTLDKTLENISVKSYLFALQQKNLVYNCDFRYYSNQQQNGDVTDYHIPDGWQYSNPGSNGSIGFDGITNQCIIKKSGSNDTMEFKQALHEFPRWQSILNEGYVTGKVVLDSGINGDVNVTIFDGIDKTTVTLATQGRQEFNLQHKLNENLTELSIIITTATPYITLKISACFVNKGMVAIESLPCMVQGVIGERKQYIATETPPAEELSLCNGLKELSNEYTRLRSVINNKFGINRETGNPYLINMGGYFSRAWDNGSGIDPDAKNRIKLGNGTIEGDRVSTLEKDVFLKHDHQLSFSTDKVITTGKEGAATIINTLTTSKTKPESDGKETRSINIAELYTIKWA